MLIPVYTVHHVPLAHESITSNHGEIALQVKGTVCEEVLTVNEAVVSKALQALHHDHNTTICVSQVSVQ
jgi:hypothetical protein